RRSVYACRPASSPCEVGIVQAELVGNGASARECVARPGCRVDEGECYCHCYGYGETRVPDGPEAERCNCACGGGPPPRCAKERGTSRAQPMRWSVGPAASGRIARYSSSVTTFEVHSWIEANSLAPGMKASKSASQVTASSDGVQALCT